MNLSRPFVAMVLPLLLAAALGCDVRYSGSPPSTPKTSPEAQPASARPRLTRPAGLQEVRVLRVVDGDTIVVEGGTRIRYIGIDTPETVHPRKPVQPYGPEASAANKRLVEGHVVGLEFDVERSDKYGRTLAYIWVGDVMLNAWLVENGFARVSTYPPNVKYASLFRDLQVSAREAGRGMWGGAPPFSTPGETVTPPSRAPPAPAQAETVYSTRTGKRYHRGSCSYLRSSRIPLTRAEAAARGLTPCKRCW